MRWNGIVMSGDHKIYETYVEEVSIAQALRAVAYGFWSRTDVVPIYDVDGVDGITVRVFKA